MAAPSKRVIKAVFFLHVVLCFCCSSFGERFDGSKYDRTETRGNSTFGCSLFGPCAPCSYSEKNDDETYHCSTTGYRQSYRCIEIESDGREKVLRRGLSSEEVSKRGLHESAEALHRWVGRKVFEAEETTMHDGHQSLHIYSSCVLNNSDEKLSVLGFEGIMLGLLAISSPILYHRKRRNFSMSGMTRLPTSARF